MTDVRMPDGVVVRFPDAMPPDQIKALIAKKFPQLATAPSQPQPNVFEPQQQQPTIGVGQDVAQQIGSGIPRGLANIAGLPADIFKAENAGLDWIYNYLTGKDYHTSFDNPVGNFVNNATSGSIKQKATDLTGITLPTAQTGAGRIAGAASEMATGAAALGGTRELGSMALNALKFGAIPGAVSETAGQGIEATGAPQQVADAARVVTALGAGGLASLKPRMTATSSADLEKAALTAKGAAMGQGVAVAPNAMVRLATNMERELRTAGGSGGSAATLNPRTNAVMNEIMDVATSGHPVTLDDLESLRRTVNHAGRAIEGSDPAMSAVMRQEMDKFIADLKPGDVITGGDPAKAASLLKEYRQAYSQSKKGELVTDLMTRAQNSASWANGNKAAAIRNEFRSLANSDEMRYFSPAEKQAILDAVRVGKFEGLVSFLGKYSPASSLRSGAVGAGVGGGVGFALGGPVGAVAGATVAPALGEAGRELANRIAMRDAGMASTILRGGKVQQMPSLFPMLNNYASSVYNRRQGGPR